MTLSTQNGISIAEIAVYIPTLIGGILLSSRHGFGRSAGWLYLILFSLVRIIGACLELATISDPTNISLYIGAVTLQNVGLSPLILLLLGLLSRVLTSIKQTTDSPVTPRHLRLVQLVVVVGLILGIVGGSQSSSSYASGATIQPNTTGRVGLVLMIVGFALLALATGIVGMQVSSAAPGEKRIVAVIVASLPFVLIRLIYSAVGTLANNNDFKPIIGSPNIQIGMSVIEEMIVVIMCESVGLTLRKIPREEQAVEGSSSEGYAMNSDRAPKHTGGDEYDYGRVPPQAEGRMYP